MELDIGMAIVDRKLDYELTLRTFMLPQGL
jgi:hypothetical protein